MRSRAPELDSVRAIIEAAFEARASVVPAGPAPAAATGAPRHVTRDVPQGNAEVATHTASVVVGEVVDTHHPHLPGRVFVRWLNEQGVQVEAWLQRERHLVLGKGERVLLTLPAGWHEWIVTGALGRESQARFVPFEGARTVQLEPGQVLRVLSHDGQPLLTLRQAESGPVLQLGEGDVELAAERTLRLRADAIELTSASGGIDLRTEGDAVIRARTIRLN